MDPRPTSGVAGRGRSGRYASRITGSTAGTEGQGVLGEDEVPYHGTDHSRGGRSLRHGWVMLGLFGVALGARLVYTYETRGVPTSWHLVGDAAGYYQWAQRIAGGEWSGTESFYQAPLYPYVLGISFMLWGDGVWKVRVLQAFWGAAACGCLGVATGRMFGRAAGLCAGLMLTLYAPAIFFDGIVQKTSLACLLVCVMLVVMTWVKTARRIYAAATLGVLGGLLSLTRENAMVWLPVLGVWIALGGGRTRGAELSRDAASKGENQTRRLRSGFGSGRALAAFTVGVALILVAVGLRNWAVSGEWSVSTFQAGPNFYIGNHRGADGRYRPLVRGHETPEFERQDAKRLAQESLGRPLSAREVSRFWMSRAIEDIRADWSGWLTLVGQKTLMVWNRYEVADVESPYVYQQSSYMLGGLLRVWHFGVLCPLAAVGLVETWGGRRRLWVLYALIASMTAAVAAFYVLARYRFPLAPLLMPFAAAGCLGVWDRVRRGDFRTTLIRLAVAGVLAAAVNWPVHDERRLNALAAMNAGVALAKSADLPGATHYFRLAVRDHPESAEANNNLAQALALQGDYAGAIGPYRAALAAAPALPGMHFNLAVALERTGRIDEAIVHYEYAIARDPSDIEAANAIARLRGRD